MTKMTKKDMFHMILNVEEVAKNETMVNFIQHELELLNKKSGSKSNAKTLANTGVKNEIISVLTNSESSMTITEVVKSLETEYSNQKISSLMKQLVESGKVVREVEKRVARFSLA